MIGLRGRVKDLFGDLGDWLVTRPIRERPNHRIDERDTMFARAERSAGTPEYADYYDRRPEYREIDDHIRRKPPLGSPESLYYDPELSPAADEYFDAIEPLEPSASVVERWGDRFEAADTPEPVLSRLGEALGAVDVGFTEIPTEYVYTHHGRFDEEYGEPVELDHQHAVVFLVEMDRERMDQAPEAPVLYESAKQYYTAATIAKTMAAVLRDQGFEAKPQYDANYEVVLPALAVEAGLGELGRNNILVADNYGSRVRIGAVTTTLPLRNESPVSLGVERFCRSCNRCATACPANALETGEKRGLRGTEKWPTAEAQCYSFWRHAGTDCGICMAECPFSHPNTRFHAAVRNVIKWAPWMAPVILAVDERIEG